MNRGLLAALAITLLAVAYVSQQDEAVTDDTVAAPRAVRSAGSGSPRATPPAAADDGALLAAAPARGEAEVGHDLFAPHSFLPPPPPASTRPAPPPPPMAPPLPFRYQGRMTEGSSTVVFLTHGERVLVARQGDLLNNQYRVESVGPTAITFLFEPLKQRQTLSTGNTK